MPRHPSHERVEAAHKSEEAKRQLKAEQEKAAKAEAARKEAKRQHKAEKEKAAHQAPSVDALVDSLAVEPKLSPIPPRIQLSLDLALSDDEQPQPESTPVYYSKPVYDKPGGSRKRSPAPVPTQLQPTFDQQALLQVLTQAAELAKNPALNPIKKVSDARLAEYQSAQRRAKRLRLTIGKTFEEIEQVRLGLQAVREYLEGIKHDADNVAKFIDSIQPNSEL